MQRLDSNPVLYSSFQKALEFITSTQDVDQIIRPLACWIIPYTEQLYARAVDTYNHCDQARSKQDYHYEFMAKFSIAMMYAQQELGYQIFTKYVSTPIFLKFFCKYFGNYSIDNRQAVCAAANNLVQYHEVIFQNLIQKLTEHDETLKFISNWFNTEALSNYMPLFCQKISEIQKYPANFSDYCCNVIERTGTYNQEVINFIFSIGGSRKTNIIRSLCLLLSFNGDVLQTVFGVIESVLGELAGRDNLTNDDFVPVIEAIQLIQCELNNNQEIADHLANMYYLLASVAFGKIPIDPDSQFFISFWSVYFTSKSNKFDSFCNGVVNRLLGSSDLPAVFARCFLIFISKSKGKPALFDKDDDALVSYLQEFIQHTQYDKNNPETKTILHFNKNCITALLASKFIAQIGLDPVGNSIHFLLTFANTEKKYYKEVNSVIKAVFDVIFMNSDFIYPVLESINPQLFFGDTHLLKGYAELYQRVSSEGKSHMLNIVFNNDIKICLSFLSEVTCSEDLSEQIFQKIRQVIFEQPSEEAISSLGSCIIVLSSDQQIFSNMYNICIENGHGFITRFISIIAKELKLIQSLGMDKPTKRGELANIVTGQYQMFNEMINRLIQDLDGKDISTIVKSVDAVGEFLTLIPSEFHVNCGFQTYRPIFDFSRKLLVIPTYSFEKLVNYAANNYEIVIQLFFSYINVLFSNSFDICKKVYKTYASIIKVFALLKINNAPIFRELLQHMAGEYQSLAQLTFFDGTPFLDRLSQLQESQQLNPVELVRLFIRIFVPQKKSLY